MKRFITFLCLALIYGSGIAQPQITWRFANPEIIRQGDSDRLEFDLQVKASQPGTYFWSGQYILTFNNDALAKTTTFVTVLRSGISNQFSDELGDQKYAITRTITGTEPNLRINVALTPTDIAILHEQPGADWSAEITTEWQTFTRLRIRIDNPALLAGVTFIEASMNGQIAYHGAPGVITYYENPNLYVPLNLDMLHLGRVYSNAHGWSQIGPDEIDWATDVNTSVFDGNATITQADNTVALANNLNVMPGANLTLGANKWLTVNGTLETPNATALIVLDEGSLIHGASIAAATMERSMPAINYRMVSAPVSQMVIFGSDWAPTGLQEMDLYWFNEAVTANEGLYYPWVNIRHNDNGNIVVNHLFGEEFLPARGYLSRFDAGGIKTFIGNLNSGDISIPISRTETTIDAIKGWNILGNPYPSGYFWNGANYSSILDNAYAYILQEDGTYGYHGEVTIAPNQGFFVRKKVGGDPNFTFFNNRRVHGGIFAKQAEVAGKLVFSLTNGLVSDLTTINLLEGSLFDRDFWDAYKLFSIDQNNRPQLFSNTFDGVKVAINSIPQVRKGDEITLGIFVPSSGQYTIDLKESTGVFQYEQLYIEDILTGLLYDLNETPELSFFAQKGTTDFRFKLMFENTTGTGPLVEQETQVFVWQNQIYINFFEIAESRALQVFDTSGRLVASYQLGSSLNHIIPFNWHTGVYIVRIQGVTGIISRKVIVP